MASTRMNTTLSGSGVNPKKWTFSAWIKRGALQDGGKIFSAFDGGNYYHDIKFNTSDRLVVYCHNNGNAGNLQSARLFRDPNAWYHVVVNWDTAQSDQEDRCKMWVNNERITDWHSATYPAQNVNGTINDGYVHTIGAGNTGSYGDYFNGCMSHIHFAGNQSYDPTTFGEIDATDGMWKIKTSPTVNYTQNGFFLKMEDSSNLDLDSSGQNRSFTTTGTLTATKDNPSNNMSTLFPNIPFPSGLTISNGNTSIASTATQWAGRYSTQRVFSGKYYVEAQFVSTGHNFKFGVQGEDANETTNWSTLNTSYAGKSAVGYEFQCNNGNGYKVNNNSSPTWTNANFTPATSTIMMAFDLDNGKIWWGRNGTWFNTSGTANPATGTDAAFTGITTANGPYLFGLSLEGNGSSSHINFGNGYFGTTAIGSPVTSNEGIWAYAPPTGFGAVNTKWINTF